MYKGKAWTFLYLKMIFIIPNFNICMNLPWSLIHVLIFSLWADICEFLDKTASCKCELFILLYAYVHSIVLSLKN